MKRILALTVLMAVTVSGWAGTRENEPAEPFDRGIGTPNSLFIPKGTIGLGLSIAYDNYGIGNAADDAGYQMMFSMLNGMRGGMTSFGVAPQLQYFFTDNTSIGLRFDYGKTSLGIDGLNLSLTDDMSFSINDMNYLKQAYSGSLTLRHYMAIAESRRFAMFVEGRATYGYAQSESYQMDGQDKFGTYQDIYNASLGLVPGLVCFMTDEAAIEVSVGVLGFDYQKVRQTTNQVDYSEMEKSGANFKINLLSVNFGMTFYIPTGNKKSR